MGRWWGISHFWAFGLDRVSSLLLRLFSSDLLLIINQHESPERDENSGRNVGQQSSSVMIKNFEKRKAKIFSWGLRALGDREERRKLTSLSITKAQWTRSWHQRLPRAKTNRRIKLTDGKQRNQKAIKLLSRNSWVSWFHCWDYSAEIPGEYKLCRHVRKHLVISLAILLHLQPHRKLSASIRKVRKRSRQ